MNENTIWYRYNGTTGEYIGSFTADIVGGQEITDYLGATKIAPEAPQEEYANVFNTSTQAWSNVENHVGEEGYINREWIKIKELGELPEGFTHDLPELEKTFEEQKQDKLTDLSTKSKELEEKGFLVSSLGFPIDANTTSIRNIEGLILVMEKTGTQSTSFCDCNNNLQDVSLEQIKTMQLEVITFGQQMYATKWLLREQINNAVNKEELDAIVIDFGEQNIKAST